MNFHKLAGFWRHTPVDGWNAAEAQWEETALRGNLRAVDQNVTGTDYSLKKRVWVCPAKDRIIPKYYSVRIEGIVYLLESESPSLLHGKPYQYIYQLRRADNRAILYEHASGSVAASGMPTQNDRQVIQSTHCDFVSSGSLSSTEIDEAAYARYRVYLPYDAVLSDDIEIDFIGEKVHTTVDVVATQAFNLCWMAIGLRRGIST